jgi:hypothetical protein
MSSLPLQMLNLLKVERGEVEEAKDAIDGALRGNLDNRHLIPDKSEAD